VPLLFIRELLRCFCSRFVLPSFFGFVFPQLREPILIGHLQVSLYVLGDRWRFAPQVSAAVAVTARAVPLR
jgi:hypothetical protein